MEREITLLHANDIHGRLNFTVGPDLMVQGGISLLSGYVKKVRSERDTFFGICGDVLQEDVTGSDYKGTSTVELINHLRPDAISLGNHELDYGLAHLLIFKECLKSNVLCANIRVSSLSEMLFRPGFVYETGGVRILFIGVIPQAFFNGILSDEFCRNTIEYVDSYDAIREEIKAHSGEHIDLVVLMSHYGIDGDRTLAAGMPEDIRVDLILGGHTHIDMDEAEVINGIPIAQSSYGTTHIGRFDLTVDTEGGGIRKWTWQRVPLNEETAEFDTGVDDLADRVIFFKKKNRENATICEFEEQYTQYSRVLESQLGDIIADAFADIFPVDLVILQAGSIRRKECGPAVTEKDLKELYPFDDRYTVTLLTGREIKDAFEYLFSLKEDGSVMNGTFQYSRGFRLVVDGSECWTRGCFIKSMTLNGQEFEDDRLYRIGLTANCLKEFYRYFHMNPDPERIRTVSLSTYNALATHFLLHEGKITAPATGERFLLLGFTE